MADPRLLGCAKISILICWGLVLCCRFIGLGTQNCNIFGPGAPLLLPSLLDKAPRQGDIQEFAAARRVAIACVVGSHVTPGTWSHPQQAILLSGMTLSKQHASCHSCPFLLRDTQSPVFWNLLQTGHCSMPLSGAVRDATLVRCHSWLLICLSRNVFTPKHLRKGHVSLAVHAYF